MLYFIFRRTPKKISIQAKHLEHENFSFCRDVYTHCSMKNMPLRWIDKRQR